MTIRNILTEPNKTLRQISKNVDKVGKEEQELMNDMLETMYAANGIGLAAIQIGVPKRIIVMDLSKEKEKKPMFFVNPKINNKNKIFSVYEEGCLSVPGVNVEVMRPDKVKLNWLDIKGNNHEMHPEGLLTVCIQHEIDHLEGKLIADFLSPLKQSRLKKKATK